MTSIAQWAADIPICQWAADITWTKSSWCQKTNEPADIGWPLSSWQQQLANEQIATLGQSSWYQLANEQLMEAGKWAADPRWQISSWHRLANEQLALLGQRAPDVRWLATFSFILLFSASQLECDRLTEPGCYKFRCVVIEERDFRYDRWFLTVLTTFTICDWKEGRMARIPRLVYKWCDRSEGGFWPPSSNNFDSRRVYRRMFDPLGTRVQGHARGKWSTCHCNGS